MVFLTSAVLWALQGFIAGPHSDPLRAGFQATSLDSDEVVRLLDACIRHQDHFNGFKVAAMVLLGTAMGFRGEMCNWCIITLQCCDLMPFNAGDDLMDAKPSLLALTPVVRCVPVPMQVITWWATMLQGWVHVLSGQGCWELTCLAVPWGQEKSMLMDGWGTQALLDTRILSLMQLGHLLICLFSASIWLA